MSKITTEIEGLIKAITTEINTLSFVIECAEDRGLSAPVEVMARQKCQVALDRLLKLKEKWESEK